jgi:Fur family transcriptional regulator, ferric uptake regulator
MKLKFNFKIGRGTPTETFRTVISSGGLKATKQREDIFKLFLKLQGHRNIAEIYAQVTKMNPKIGYTTVYRTLKLLTRLGLAEERKFGDGEARYEPIARGGHHDHFICLGCGKIIEFEDRSIEALQNRIAERYRFKILHHRMELYGRCATCSAKKAPPERRG